MVTSSSTLGFFSKSFLFFRLAPKVLVKKKSLLKNISSRFSMLSSSSVSESEDGVVVEGEAEGSSIAARSFISSSFSSSPAGRSMASGAS